MKSKFINILIRTIFSVMVILRFQCSYADGQVDNYLNNLKNATNDSSKISVLIALSKEYTQSDLSKALNYAEKALEQAEKINDSKQISHALLNIGNVYNNQGLYEIALRHYYRYLEIQKEEGNKKEIAYIQINLGAINLSLENYNQARKNFEESLLYFEKLPVSPHDRNLATALLSNYNNLGIVYQKLKKPERAISYYSEGIKVGRNTPAQENLLAKLLNNLGSLYLEERNMPDALSSINEALKIRLQLNDKTGLAQSYRTLSEYYSNVGQVEKSIDYLQKGLAIAQLVGHTPLQAEISEGLFDQYYKLGNADSALKYQILLRDLQNKLNIDESKNEVIKLELTAQFNEREKDREIKQQKREFRFILLGITLALSLVIISLLYLILRSRLNRMKLEKDVIHLASKNLELEKASLVKELEVKNKELTTSVMSLVQKNEFISVIAQRVKNLAEVEPENANRLSELLFAELNRNTNNKIWKEFEIRFQEVHHEFYSRLNQRFPGLTPNEKKLAAFLRLNMSTKDISTITFQSPDSIRIARSRLRKKMELSPEIDLIDFLEKI